MECRALACVASSRIVGRRRGVAWWLAIVGCHASPAPAADTGDGSTTTIATTTSATDTSSSSTTDGSTTEAIVDGPPVVLDIGKSATFLEEDERLVITAFVQHPRGAEAVALGELVGPGEPTDYGAFVRGVNGRWSIEIGWADIGARMDLTFENELILDFEARFVDDAGLDGIGEFPIRLRCIPLAPQACHGVCADIDVSTNHCGGCDQPCVIQYPEVGVPIGGCDLGTCAPLWSSCVDALEHSDCASACAAFGANCIDSGCAGQTILPLESDATCDGDVLPYGYADPDTCTSPFPSGFARCCCAP